VCISSIGCVLGYVNLFDSLYHDSVIIQEVEEPTNNLLGGHLIALDPKPVQQKTWKVYCLNLPLLEISNDLPLGGYG